MTRYVLNSAVITGPGLYRYRLLSISEARTWLAQGPVVSRIGYRETAEFIRQSLGVDLPLSREASPMAPGDQALVIRLRYRLSDPGLKGQVVPGPEDWEIGLLECLAEEER